MESIIDRRGSLDERKKRDARPFLHAHRLPSDELASQFMAAPSFPDSTHPLYVFVVENHPDTLRALRMYLEGLGHLVQSAGNVEAALATIPHTRCDVLISDIGLPDGSGWDLLHTLNAQGHAPAYAIAMSGFGMSADHVHSREAGFRHHLLKPFAPDDLDAMLEEALSELHAAP